ncbi:MAG TPA: hypothetical protein VGD67_14530 [Pseudonocardiaceae bacterium]
MELARFVDHLGRELGGAAEAAREDGKELAERLVAQLTPAIRLTLLEALSAAADEITRDLAPGSVEIRLRGLDPAFVVTLPAEEDHRPGYDDELDDEHDVDPLPPPADPAARASGQASANGDGGATSRINFRPPEYLKIRIEEAAARERLSVNAWLVRSVSSALEADERGRRLERRAPRRASGRAERYTGWVK